MPFYKTNMDLVRRRRQELLKQEEEREHSAIMDKLVDGQNLRRILPPWSEKGAWCAGAPYHFLYKRSFVCPGFSNLPCMICEERQAFFKSNTTEDREAAKALKAKMRYFANVLNLDKNDGKVYIMAFGVTLEAELTAKMDVGSGGGDSFGFGDITDPKAGRNVRITKTVPVHVINGTPVPRKDLTEYALEVSQTVTPIANWETIQNGLHDLDAFVAKDVVTPEEAKAIFLGQSAPSAAPVSQPAPSPVNKITDEFEAPKAAMSQATGVTAATVSKPQGAASALEKLKRIKEQKAAQSS